MSVHKKRQVLYEIKDIFTNVFDILDSLFNNPIMEQIIHIVDRIKDEYIETDVKLMEWSERMFHTNFMDKIFSAIELTQVDLSTKIV